MYFAQHNVLLYGRLESSNQYVVQVVRDMFDKYEQFLEVSLCQYKLHMNNIFVGLRSFDPTLSVFFYSWERSTSQSL